MSERRYDESQIAEIFERATRADQERRALASGDEPTAEAPGMTLQELQRIGAEVGISADAIEASARAIDRSARPPEVNRRLLGLPIGVMSVEPLPRRLSDEEWARLVTRIRDEFGAHGTLEETRTLRSWRNGNLRVQLEPTRDGQKLRMQTYRQSSRALLQAGSAVFGTGVVLGAVSIVVGDAQAALVSFSILAAAGAGMLGTGILGLRGWARTRMAQMARLTDLATQMASRALPGTAGATGSERDE